MLSGDKTFSTFDSPQKPLGFVCVNRVLNVLTVRNQLKIIEPIICAVQIFMVNFHSFWDGAIKCLPHRAMDRYLSVFSVFAWTKPYIMVARNMRFNRARGAISRPCLTMLNVKRGRNASTKKFGDVAQRSPVRKHIFSNVNLFGAKQFSTRHTPNTRKIADFVNAFVAAHRFPSLHTVDIKPVYVGGQA